MKSLKFWREPDESGMTRDQQKKLLVVLYASYHGWESTLKVPYRTVAVNCSLLMLYHTSGLEYSMIGQDVEIILSREFKTFISTALFTLRPSGLFECTYYGIVL